MCGDSTLYPMLGVGAFMVMFWVGFVLGYEAGLGCLILLSGLLFGVLGTQLVVKLERGAGGRSRHAPAARAQRAGGLPAPAYRRAD